MLSSTPIRHQICFFSIAPFQNLRRCVGIQKRLIVKTLNVVVADGVLEMTPKQRGELLKLVQEMGDIDINSSEVTTNQSSLFRSRDWLSANQGPVFPGPVCS